MLKLTKSDDLYSYATHFPCVQVTYENMIEGKGKKNSYNLTTKIVNIRNILKSLKPASTKYKNNRSRQFYHGLSAKQTNLTRQLENNSEQLCNFSSRLSAKEF